MNESAWEKSWAKRTRPGRWAPACLVLTLVFGLVACDGTVPQVPPSDDGIGNDNGSLEEPIECLEGAAIETTTVSYVNDLVPLLEQKGCLTTGCHGGGLHSFNYNLESYEGIFGPGNSARALGLCNIVPGDPDASFLIEKISSDSPSAGVRMPQNRPPLSEEEIALIRTWIEEGAANN